MKRLLILSMLIASSNVLALNLQGYRFSDSYRFAVLDDSLKDRFPGKYVATASLGYVKNPFYVTDKKVSKRFSNIISYHQVLTLGYSYYYNETISFGVDANLIANKVAGKSYSDLGDTILKGKWNMFKQNTFSVSLNPQIYLPTGNKDAFTTTESLGGSLNLVTEFASNQWHFLASLGYFSADENKYMMVDYRNLFMSQLGISYDLNEAWNVNFEAVNTYSTISDHIQDEGDYYITFKDKINPNSSIFFGGGLAGLDKVNRDNYTFFAGVKIHEVQ